MSHIAHTWVTGDVINAAPLNALEADLAAAAVVADIATPGTATGDALRSAYLVRGAASVDLCAAPYNCAPGADITTALQTALNWVAANCPNGGDLYFSQPGTYLINGALQTGTAQGYTYNGQILIPPVSLAGSMPIRIRGAFPSSGGGQSTGAPNGVVLKSNATTGYVFDIQPGFTEFGCPWTGVMPIFENLVIRNAVDNPTAGGLNLYCTQRAKLERVQIDTPNSFVAPVAGTLPALVMPMIYNNGDVTVRDCTIRGYPVGVQLGEHGVFDNVDVAYCMTAFKGGGASHANWFGYVDVEECPTMFDGGTTPAFGAPAVGAGTVIYGFLDYENVNQAGLAPTAFVKDSPTNPVTGKLDIWGTVGGTFPTQGGKFLDLTPVNSPPSLGPRPRGAGWTETHPYDNFTRQIALSGAGAPGQSSPSLHPWRVEKGSFSVSGGQLKGLTGDDRCMVPVLKAASWGAISRTVTWTVTIGAAGLVRLFAMNPVTTGGVSVTASGSLTGIEVKCAVGAQPILRLNNNNVITATGATWSAGETHTVKLAVYCNALGYPYAVRVYIDGILRISSGIAAAYSALGLSSPSVWPYYEDGMAIQDTASSVSLFSAQDLAPDAPYVVSGTATLVAGTVAVTGNTITPVTSGAVIRYWRTTAGGTLGQLSLVVTAATGFTINSSSNTDTSTVYYEIVSY